MNHSVVGVKPVIVNKGGKPLQKRVVTMRAEDGFLKTVTSNGMS
jgi:hypothetical protein